MEDTSFSAVDAMAQASRVVEDGEVVGDVEFIARTIQEETGGGRFAIETNSYSPIGNSLHIFRELAPGAAIAEGLTANSKSDIRPWVDQVMSQAAQ